MSKLLIADDDPDILHAMETFAKTRGYEVVSATRGDDALDLAREHRPDAILLDIMMPGLDGRDVMKRLQAEGIDKQAVVIFVTARDAQSDRLVGLELGAHEYETKPVHIGRLFDKIARLLEKRRAGEF